MRKIRVLIVDDAAAVRRLVIDALAIDPELQVVGTAENGRIALDRIPKVAPDIIVLDIEMPVMGGLETLVEVRRAYPKLPVIVFSSDSRPGAEATLDALWLGANDYVTKSRAESPAAAVRYIHAELVPRIKALCVDVLSHADEAPVDETQHARRERGERGRSAGSRPTIKVVAIGASTGGPNALGTLLNGLSADFPVPILIVQHMPPLFTKFLAERLSAKSPLEIVEAADGDVLRPGKAWIAPGDFHMTVDRVGSEVCARIAQGPPVNSCRPSVDILFRSVADVYGACALGVILTGMGQDGLRGCERLAWSRGQVLAQDEESSVVWGMPGIVSKSGLADRVLSIDEMSAEITHRVSAGRTRRSAAA
jgi:two-component system, chemotaxis family, protein-glutamate methylesterase/glutaminase